MCAKEKQRPHHCIDRGLFKLYLLLYNKQNKCDQIWKNSTIRWYSVAYTIQQKPLACGSLSLSLSLYLCREYLLCPFRKSSLNGWKACADVKCLYSFDMWFKLNWCLQFQKQLSRDIFRDGITILWWARSIDSTKSNIFLQKIQFELQTKKSPTLPHLSTIFPRLQFVYHFLHTFYTSLWAFILCVFIWYFSFLSISIQTTATSISRWFFVSD